MPVSSKGVNVFRILLMLLTSLAIPAKSQDTIPATPDTTIIMPAGTQDTNNYFLGPVDTSSYPQDIINPGARNVAVYKVSGDTLPDPIDYSAADSFKVVVPEKTIYLYGNAHVIFQDFDLRAARVEYNWEKSEVKAYGIPDSLGRLSGKPEFKQGGKSYLAEELRYNFKTEKGKSKGLVTTESEGFLHGVEVKSIGEDILYGRNVRYTTCEYEHPHYFIEVNKAKIVKDKVIVGKPANLVVGDVHTPLIIPFGLFPIQEQRTSGIIFPQYGYSPSLGYYLSNGGYYWAINDYMDLAATATIYTRGSWELGADYSYIKKYKYSGNVNVNFASTVATERRSPNFAGPNRDFRINWNMRVDPKRLYNSDFRVSVNGGTSTYQSNILTDQETFLNTSLNSSISYQKWWPGNPFRISVNASHSQNTSSRLVNLKLPEFSLTMSSVNPFERRVSTGGRKWYENITVNYSMNARNEVSAPDSVFFTRETLDEMKNGIRHQAGLNIPIRLFGKFNFATSFNYTDRWYFETTRKEFRDTLVTDGDTLFNTVDEFTVNGFKSGRDYSLSASINWRLFGTFNFRRTKRVKAFRHVMTPSINFNYRPDFGKERYGYYRTFANAEGVEQTYSIFEDGIYGSPSRGTVGSIGFSLNNNFEMKVLARRDTTAEEKKIKLLDNFNLAASYNLAADSLQLSPLTFNGSTRLMENISFNFNGSLDPYYTNPETNRRVDRFLVTETGRLFRMTRFSLNLNGNFQSKRRFDEGGDGARSMLPPKDRTAIEALDENRSLVVRDPVYGNVITYVDFDVPWSLLATYNVNLSRRFNNGRDSLIVTQALRARIDLSLTRNWKINVSTGYDFTNREFNRTDISILRDLHCWQLGFNWVPNGTQRSYSIILNVKSQMLNFLKLERRRNQYDFG